MDWSHATLSVYIALGAVLLAELMNGWTDAPTGTSAAVASKVLSSKQALWITAIGNFLGLILALILGAAVAHTIGKGIIQPSFISIDSITIAMLATVAWAGFASRVGLPVSKSHSLLAALAGIGYAQGGFAALLPQSGNWHDSGWIQAGIGVAIAILGGSAISWFLTKVVIGFKLHEKVKLGTWKHLQIGTVSAVGIAHGFNDGLKYVGIFTLVLTLSGVITDFRVLPEVIVLCAFVMGTGTLMGGWRIHKRLDQMVNHDKNGPHSEDKQFKPYMGVCAELTSAVAILQTGILGIPMSTNHTVVSAIAGAKSSNGTVHGGAIIRILWGWIVTYIFCFTGAYLLCSFFL
jgi:inorganic phosphate transporter, PiT family